MEITLSPTLKQHEAWEALNTKDVIFLGGGAGGGKSWWLCETRLINCYRYPGYRTFIGREELKRLMTSTYITWCKVCKHHNVPQQDWKLNGQYNYIEFTNGSRIDLLDLKYLPSDPLYERFGSTEYTDGALEEAGEIDFLAYDVMKSRIGRHLNKELNIRPTISITGNPKKNWTKRMFFTPWTQGLLPDNVAFIQSLYKDNPYTYEEYGKQLSGITDKTMRERLMFGNWDYEDDPNAMMNTDAIQDLYTNAIDKTSDKYLIVDAARFGSDMTVMSCWKGLDWYKVVTRSKQSLTETAEDVRTLAANEGIPFSHILIDEDGIGGGVIDQLRGVKGFIANRAPTLDPNTGRPQNFKNMKAQCAYLLADNVNNHLMRVSFTDEKAKELLTADLEQYKVKNPDTDNKKQIISKDEMKEHLGRSPDYGDCALMRMYFEIKKQPEYKDYTQSAYEPMSPFEGNGYVQPDFDT